MFHKETPLVKEAINFTIKTLAFQNRYLNDVHSVLDVKLSWQKDYMGENDIINMIKTIFL